MTTDRLTKQIADAMRDAHEYIFHLRWQEDIEHRIAQKVCGALTQAIYALPVEPTADLAELNRELCRKEGHVLGVIARPCLRCHEWFDPSYSPQRTTSE